MIETLLPAAVAAEHAYDDSLPGELYPEESAAVGRAVDKRRQEYRTARLCARRALTRLGAPVGPLLAGHRGAPQWPAGVVGSLTHCDGYRAAAVAWRQAVAAVGIDAEPDAPLPAGVLDLVTVPAERLHLAGLPVAAGVAWDRLLFSAKEALFKAWYPVTGRELTFREAATRFTVDAAGRSGGFDAEVLVDPTPFPARVGGRWRADRGLVLATVTVRPDELAG